MKFTSVLTSFLSGRVIALSLPAPGQSGCEPVFLNATTNIWKKYTLNVNPFYREKVLAAVEAIKSPDLKEKALKVADVGTFVWVDHILPTLKLEKALVDVPCQNVVGIVLQGLNTGADCASPKFTTLEVATYQRVYVDPLARILIAHPNRAFAIIVEPYTLPAIIANSTFPSCRGLATSYYRPGATYALKALNLPNVVMYLDAGHGGNLGFEYNLRPAAEELSAVYRAAGSPSQLRGIAVNTDGYNSWDLSPGEFSTTREDFRNYALNEKSYISRLASHLNRTGMPYHAIADMSRSGVHGLRWEWKNWCNVDGAGFGRRPSTENLGLDMADALVWVKNGGMSDGTSDPESPNYSPFCGSADAYKPAPEKGKWNQGYFEMLVENAKPSL